jgi:uncharacterized protein YacL
MELSLWQICVIFLLPIAAAPIVFRMLQKRHNSPLEAQRSSIQNHYYGTAFNSIGLFAGIFMVFFLSKYGEQFVDLGMIVVLLSIIAFVGYEWVAFHDDQQIATFDSNDENQSHRQLLEKRYEIQSATLRALGPEKAILRDNAYVFIYPGQDLAGADKEATK